jgi:hypothetical protein
MLALVLSACAAKVQPVVPIPAVPQNRVCPAYPLPPQELLKAPRTDFLSSAPNKESSSTN